MNEIELKGYKKAYEDLLCEIIALQIRIDKAINKLEKLYSFNNNDRLTCDEIRNTLLILKGEK